MKNDKFKYSKLKKISVLMRQYSWSIKVQEKKILFQ